MCYLGNTGLWSQMYIQTIDCCVKLSNRSGNFYISLEVITHWFLINHSPKTATHTFLAQRQKLKLQPSEWMGPQHLISPPVQTDRWAPIGRSSYHSPLQLHASWSPPSTTDKPHWSYLPLWEQTLHLDTSSSKVTLNTHVCVHTFPPAVSAAGFRCTNIHKPHTAIILMRTKCCRYFENSFNK